MTPVNKPVKQPRKPVKPLTLDLLVRVRGGALITEIGFPACDGAGKDPAF